MTETDFTDVQLHQAAAALHHSLTTSPEPDEADRFLRRHPLWDQVEAGGPRHIELRARVADLVNRSADVSEWSVELGALSLAPFHTHVWRTETGIDVAVQLAAGEGLAAGFRNEIARAVREAVEGVYERYLNQVPQKRVPAVAR